MENVKEIKRATTNKEWIKGENNNNKRKLKKENRYSDMEY